MRLRIPLALATAAAALAGCVTVQTATAAPAAARHRAGPEARQQHACSSSVAIRGWSDSLDKTTFRGLPVAGLSALAPDDHGRYVALSDRSALFTLDVARGPVPHARTVGAAPLADANGAPLDSEGLVVRRDAAGWSPRRRNRPSGGTRRTAPSPGNGCRCRRCCASSRTGGRSATRPSRG
ncbi:esterase-like activity of phytase family protein [Streptomyces albus]